MFLCFFRFLSNTEMYRIFKDIEKVRSKRTGRKVDLSKGKSLSSLSMIRNGITVLRAEERRPLFSCYTS